MKKLYFIITLFISFSLLSCSPDDDTTKSDSTKLIKIIERYRNGSLSYHRTINYNSSNKIETMINNIYRAPFEPYKDNITVNYSKNLVSSITHYSKNGYNYSTNEEITYNVSFDKNLITLTSDERIIEIVHSNGYVDSLFLRFYNRNPSDYSKRLLTRDKNQNLISVASGFRDRITIVDTYSDFDSGKKPDPYGVTNIMHNDYLVILGLKLTANNPRISSQSILGSKEIKQHYTYKYDDEGYITRTYVQNVVGYTDTFYLED